MDIKKYFLDESGNSGAIQFLDSAMIVKSASITVDKKDKFEGKLTIQEVMDNNEEITINDCDIIELDGEKTIKGKDFVLKNATIILKAKSIEVKNKIITLDKDLYINITNGDVKIINKKLNFEADHASLDGLNYFLLGCINIDISDEKIASFLKKLKTDYNITTNKELKSSHICKHFKPKFKRTHDNYNNIFLEIASFLKQNSAEIIIDCVDKYYGLIGGMCISLDNILAWSKPFLYYPKDDFVFRHNMLKILNFMKEEHNDLILEYVNLVDASIDDQFKFINKFQKILATEKDMMIISYALSDIYKSKTCIKNCAIKHNINIFCGDVYKTNKGNKIYFMLHNRAISNLLLLAGKNTRNNKKILFVHDDQKAFKHALERTIEEMNRGRYGIKASIIFKDSQTHSKIQLIDIIIGIARFLVEHKSESGLSSYNENAKEEFYHTFDTFLMNCKMTYLIPEEKYHFIHRNISKEYEDHMRIEDEQDKEDYKNIEDNLCIQSFFESIFRDFGC